MKNACIAARQAFLRGSLSGAACLAESAAREDNARGLLANRLLFQAQRHLPAAPLAWAGWARGGAPLAAAILALYLAANALGGRMTAAAAAFFLLAAPLGIPGSGPSLAAWAVLAALLGRAASVAYQRAEVRWLVPWAREKGLRILIEGPGSVLFWSAVLLAVTLACAIS